MRHAPNDSARRLLESLGVSWRIDPNAARCERSCGDPACRAKDLSRRELDAIRILIDDRTRKANLPGVRERVDREIEAGVRVVRNPQDVTLVTRANGSIRETEAGPVFVDRECKIDGCENRANARYDRGLLAGKCWEVHVPEGREQYSRQGRESHAASSGRLLRPRAELSPHPTRHRASTAGAAARAGAAPRRDRPRRRGRPSPRPPRRRASRPPGARRPRREPVLRRRRRSGRGRARTSRRGRVGVPGRARTVREASRLRRDPRRDRRARMKTLLWVFVGSVASLAAGAWALLWSLDRALSRIRW